MSFVEIFDEGEKNIGGKGDKINGGKYLQEMAAVVDVGSEEEYHPNDVPYKFEGQEHDTGHGE